MRPQDYKMIQGGNIRTNMSAGAARRVADAAGQSGRAFSKMGEDLASAGMEVAGMFEEAEKLHNEGKMAEYQNELDTEYSNFQNNMMSDPNRALEWRAEYDKVLERKQSELSKMDISGTLRNSMTNYLNEFAGDSRIKVSHAAHKTAISNANNGFMSRAQHLIDTGRHDEAEAYLQSAPLSLPSYKVQSMMDTNKDSQMMEMYRQKFTSDPYGWDENPDEDLEGLSPSQSRAVRATARKAARQNEYEATNEIQRQIDGLVLKTEEDVDRQAKADNLSAASTIELKQYLRSFQTEQNKEYYRNPDNENRAYFELEGMISAYDPDVESIEDGAYTAMATRLALLPDSPRKKQYQNYLDRVVNDRQGLIESGERLQMNILKSSQKVAMDSLEARKPETIEKTAREFVDDGFLRGRKQLEKYFDEKEVEMILNADEKVWVSEDKQEYIKTEDARIKMFKNLWHRRKRNGGTKFEKELGKALGMGKLTTVLASYEDEAAGRAWQNEVNALMSAQGGMQHELIKAQSKKGFDFDKWMKDNAVRPAARQIEDDYFGFDRYGDGLLPRR